MRHGGLKVLFTVLMVSATGAFFLGCSKKATKADGTPEPTAAAEPVVVAQPAPALTPAAAPAATPAARERGGETSQPAAARQAEEQRAAQLLASRGEDIPIKESPAIEFTEPAATDKFVLTPIYFDYDKSNIRPEFQPVLQGIAKWMAAQTDRQLLIEGHCDERGTDEYNLALGERRALVVRRYLVALGIAADRMHTISYGEEKPADSGHDETAWAKNRRSEFKVSTQ